MADIKFEENLSLREIYDALKSKNCLKSLLESADNLTEILLTEKITKHCENLDKKLEKFELNVQICQKMRLRDEVLNNLGLLWEIFCSGIDCPSFFLLFKTFCNGSLMKVLFKCLKCNEHFIAFQSYKMLCEIYKRFPNLVLCGRFEELINLSLTDNSENCHRWLPVYTVEIIKALLLLSESWLKDFHETSSESQQNICSCIFAEENKNQIYAKEIRRVLCCHWLKLTNRFLARLSTVSNLKMLPSKDAQVSKFDALQQILTTMLSYGNTFIESYDRLLANQKILDFPTHEERVFENGKLITNDVVLPISETLKNSKRARHENENSSDILKVHHGCHMCNNPVFERGPVFECGYPSKCFGGNMVVCGPDDTLRLLEEIFIQLVEVDHKNCLLHFSRTVFEFLNSVVSFISERCLSREKTNSCGDEIRWSTDICSFLVKSSERLLENIPQVIAKVNFGGQNCPGKRETSDICHLSYDEVSLRKVLLLVPKLTLVTEKDLSEKIIQWQVLKEPIESWLNLVTQTSCIKSQPNTVWLVQLFSDQDDELVSLLFSLLQLYQVLFSSKSFQQPIPSWAIHLCNSFNPHCFFMEFLISINYDHSLLLDFLISNETHFLAYFLKYLRHLANDWHGFMETFERRHVQSNQEVLQPSGTMQVPKEISPEFSNGGSDQFCWTRFSDGDSDGDEVFGSLSHGDDEGDCGVKEAAVDGFSAHADEGSHGDDDGRYGNDIVGYSDGSDAGGCVYGSGNGYDKYSESVGQCCRGSVVCHDGNDDDEDDNISHDCDIDDGALDYDCGRNDGNGDQDYSGGDSDYDNSKTNGSVDDDDDDRSYCDHQIDEGSDDCNYNIDDGDDIHGYANNADRKSTCNYDVYTACRKAASHKTSHHHNSDAQINETRDIDAHDISYKNTQPRKLDDNEEYDIFLPTVLSELNHVEQALSCLIRLRFAIERMVSKELFPYPVTALVRVMKYIETLYEKQ